ncbi:lysophospholipid acyltransferase family protein [Herbidospora cretacea]|uniref:lysophospholipid acyltransferase family protein n=1 Tax=Herbidospora cretacea TaxID=28444 RepID=UPI0007744A88|nr:lysophospholipid acyltransferase family protein [Herbidospora cretacea]
MAEIVYPPVIGAAVTMFKVLGMKINIEGAENIPTTGGAVLVSNHISYLDFLFAGFGARPANRLVRFMAKKEVFDHRISGPLMRGMHHIAVDRAEGAGAYIAALKALKAGEVVGVFAEATISQSFTVKEIKNGAVRMAAATNVPLIPMSLWGTQRLWTKGRPRKIMQRNIPVTISIGEPMRPQRREDMDAATAELHRRLSELVDKAQRSYPDDGAGTWWQPAHLGGTAPTPEEAAALDEAERKERANRGESE